MRCCGCTVYVCTANLGFSHNGSCLQRCLTHKHATGMTRDEMPDMDRQLSEGGANRAGMREYT